jgi:hypothetical protein
LVLVILGRCFPGYSKQQPGYSEQRVKKLLTKEFKVAIKKFFLLLNMKFAK